MQGEIWKPIKGYEENYCVSNYGRIKSTYHASEKFLVPRNAGRGYMQVALFKNHKAKNFSVHRLVAEHFVENPKTRKTMWQQILNGAALRIITLMAQECRKLERKCNSLLMELLLQHTIL